MAFYRATSSFGSNWIISNPSLRWALSSWRMFEVSILMQSSTVSCTSSHLVVRGQRDVRVKLYYFLTNIWKQHQKRRSVWKSWALVLDFTFSSPILVPSSGCRWQLQSLPSNWPTASLFYYHQVEWSRKQLCCFCFTRESKESIGCPQVVAPSR